MEMTLAWNGEQYTLNILGAPDRVARGRGYQTTHVGNGVCLWLACAREIGTTIRVLAHTTHYLEVFTARVSALCQYDGEIVLSLWLVDEDEDDT
jgi:hypothetical protein